MDEAIAAYTAAIQIKNDYAEAHYNLGNALMSKGQVDDAIARYQRAIQINKDYAEAHQPRHRRDNACIGGKCGGETGTDNIDGQPVFQERAFSLQETGMSNLELNRLALRPVSPTIIEPLSFRSRL